MALRLVEREELAQFLAIPVDEYPAEALEPIRLGVVNFFERLTDRASLPFSDPITGRVERHDGNGDTELVLNYPIGTITSVKIGVDPATPDETLTVADPALFTAGERTIYRRDGGTFGEFDVPRVVHVTYTTADDRPADAKLQCMRLVAQIWRQRGSEDASQETVSGYARTMANLAGADSDWVRAVEAHKRYAFR